LITINRNVLAAAALQTLEPRYSSGDTVFGQGASAQLVYVVGEAPSSYLERIRVQPAWA
jgi:hypothetical protein